MTAPSLELALARAAWEDPYCDTTPGQHTKLTAAMTTAPCGTQVGEGKWMPKLTVAKRQGLNGEWAAHVLLTGDGHSGDPRKWCHCGESESAEGWVYYERWTLSGRQAHGFLCPACRRLVQSG